MWQQANSMHATTCQQVNFRPLPEPENRQPIKAQRVSSTLATLVRYVQIWIPSLGMKDSSLLFVVFFKLI